MKETNPKFEMLHPKMTMEVLGYIPGFLNLNDPRSAKEQLHTNYGHGGGWRHFNGFQFDPTTLTITYPQDPPLKALARATFRDETILYFQHSWVMVIQADGSWEICRMD